MRDKELFRLSLFSALGFGSLIAFCVSVLSGCHYSEGTRAGIVQKFSHKGLVVKSWEGELALSGFKGVKAGNVWEFSVKDEAIVRQIQDSQATGKQVVLQYIEFAAHNPYKQDSSYVVNGVK